MMGAYIIWRSKLPPVRLRRALKCGARVVLAASPNGDMLAGWLSCTVRGEVMWPVGASHPPHTIQTDDCAKAGEDH